MRRLGRFLARCAAALAFVLVAFPLAAAAGAWLWLRDVPKLIRVALWLAWQRCVRCPVGLHDWQCVSGRANLYECEACGEVMRS